jgi:hypothetical protein
MEVIKNIEQIDWNGFKNDEEIKGKLKDLVREVHVASIQFGAMKKEEVAKAIEDHISSRGFPSRVSVSASEPNKANQRMIMGMAHSPLTRETISF